MDAPESVGERVRSARRAQDLTMTQLARAVGVPLSKVEAWEAGEADLEEHLPRVAELTGVSMQWLAHGDDGCDEAAAVRLEVLERIEVLETRVADVERTLARDSRKRAGDGGASPR